MKSFVALFAVLAVAAATQSPLVQMIVNINAANADVPASGAVSDLVSVDHQTPAFGPAPSEVNIVDEDVIAQLPVVEPLPIVLPEPVAVVDVVPEAVSVVDALPEAVAVVDALPEAVVVAPVAPAGAIELPAAVLPVAVQPEAAVNLPELLN